MLLSLEDFMAQNSAKSLVLEMHYPSPMLIR